MPEREHFTNGRCLAFGTGLTMFATSFGAQIAGWHHWITIGIGYAVGVGLMVAAAYQVGQSRLRQKQESSMPEVNAPRSAVVVQPQPNLSYVGIQGIWAKDMSGRWVESASGTGDVLSAIAIHNVLRDGEATANADNICASIRFTDELGVGPYVERAAWMGFEENEIDIPIGCERAIILGKIRDGRWFYYPNSRRYPTRPRNFQEELSAMELDNPVPKSFWLTSGPVQIEVSVYSPKTGEVQLRKCFRLKKGAGDVVTFTVLS